MGKNLFKGIFLQANYCKMFLNWLIIGNSLFKISNILSSNKDNVTKLNKFPN